MTRCVEPPWIVGEVSKNWDDGEPVSGDGRFLCELFEAMVNHNHQRGYRLHSFQLHRVMYSDTGMNETIIAVFERRGIEPAP